MVGSILRRLGFASALIATASIASVALPGTASAGKSDDTLVVAFLSEILSLDYDYTTKREYIILSQLVDEGLFNYDPKTKVYGPGVAKSYKFVNDTTIDVELRKGVKFHDGSELTAEDVAYTYNWIIDERSQSTARGTISRWLDNAEVTGRYSLVFHMKNVYPLAIRDMAMRVRLRKKDAYMVNGKIDRDAQAAHLIGLGRYKVVSFTPGQSVELTRFEDYYDQAAKPAIKKIVIRSIPDWGTQQAELMSGGIDWMYNVPLDIADNMGKTGRAVHLTGPSLRIGFIPLDAAGYTDKNGPLTKLKVRQALNYAVNRKAIVEHLVGGSASVIYSACHPAQFGCTEDVRHYDYDPAKAKQLIAEAGYPNGFPLDFWAYREKPVSEAIAADFAAVGVKVNLRYVKLPSLNKARANREIPAYFGTWGSGGTADTAAIARIHWDKTTDRNLSGDDHLYDIVLSAERTMDQAKREKLYHEALNIIADKAYWIPLYAFSVNYLTSPDLNFPMDPDGLPRLYEASWK